MVTHGLTIRLMLMCLFNWSVATFESVWSLDPAEKLPSVKDRSLFWLEWCVCMTQILFSDRARQDALVRL